MEKRKIIWSEAALTSLESALEWIGQNSIQQAEEVEQTILSELEKAAKNPEYFDWINTKLTIMEATELLRDVAIGFPIKSSKGSINILRTRHVKQRPEEYWSVMFTIFTTLD